MENQVRFKHPDPASKCTGNSTSDWAD